MDDLLTPILIVLVGGLIAWQVKRHVAFALVALQLFLVLVGAWGAFKLEQRQDTITTTQNDIQETQHTLRAERLVRSKVQGEINRYVCAENNKQDRTLAALVQVSVGGQESFGSQLDLSKLTLFDREVLASIGKIQRLTSEGKSQLQSVFRRKLRELEEETPCGVIVRAFLAASTTDDLKAIRQILRTAEPLPPKQPKVSPGQPPK